MGIALFVEPRKWGPEGFGNHFMVTVYRPDFDEQGNRVSPSTEVKAKTMEVGRKTTEVGRKTTEVGQKSTEVGRKPDFDVIMKDYRKDFRAT